MADSPTAPSTPSRNVETKADQADHTARFATRTYPNESAELNRRLFATWMAGTEATVRALFDIQNATLKVGLMLCDAALSSNRTALQHWADTTRQAQQTMWEAWRTSLRVGDQVAEVTASNLEVARH